MIAMRDTPDGEIEIVLYRPEVIGVMRDRDLAGRFVTFLKLTEPELVEEQPASFVTAAADVAEAEAQDIADEPATRATGPDYGRQVGLPAIPSEKPSAPAITPLAEVPEKVLDAALSRLAGGEKLKAVAQDTGISFGQLRGHWARHCRSIQKHLAAGGQQPCALCQKPFTPSISSPDKCARCSHG